MPSLIRRLVVFTTVEGVVVQPSGQRNPRSLGIKYGTHEISSLQSPLSPATSALVEIHGIAGTCINISSYWLSTYSYLQDFLPLPQSHT